MQFHISMKWFKFLIGKRIENNYCLIIVCMNSLIPSGATASFELFFLLGRTCSPVTLVSLSSHFSLIVAHDDTATDVTILLNYSSIHDHRVYDFHFMLNQAVLSDHRLFDCEMLPNSGVLSDHAVRSNCCGFIKSSERGMYGRDVREGCMPVCCRCSLPSDKDMSSRGMWLLASQYRAMLLFNKTYHSHPGHKQSN